MSFGSRNSILFCLFSRVLGVLMLLWRMIRLNGLGIRTGAEQNQG